MCGAHYVNAAAADPGAEQMTDEVVRILEDDPCVSALAVVPGAAVRPAGDLVLADIAREAANDIIDRLRATGLHREGTIEIQPVSTWLSSSGFDAELKAPATARTLLFGRRSRSAPMRRPNSTGPS